MKGVIEVSPALLRGRPLPRMDRGDKEARGRLLVIAGSEDVPGAALLTAEAALRAGAGKVTVVAPGSCIMALGMALPEARVLAMPRRAPANLWHGLNAAVVGPGMSQREADLWALAALRQETGCPLLLDAAAMAKMWTRNKVSRRQHGDPDRYIVTPHAGELAGCSGRSKDLVLKDPVASAREAADHLGALVVLKGPTTVIATGDGKLFRHRATVPGLAMSGSGDVLAGVIGGLLARGTSPLDAALWGVALHAQAGRRLAGALGTIGYRASDLSAEVPALMDKLGGR